MAQANVMDFVGLIVRCLNSSSRGKMDGFLKPFSFIVSIIFVSVFTYEMIQQYVISERLAKIDKTSQTEHEKKLAGIYFDGLNKQEVKKNWWVRHFNLLFVL